MNRTTWMWMWMRCERFVNGTTSNANAGSAPIFQGAYDEDVDPPDCSRR